MVIFFNSWLKRKTCYSINLLGECKTRLYGSAVEINWHFGFENYKDFFDLDLLLGNLYKVVDLLIEGIRKLLPYSIAWEFTG